MKKEDLAKFYFNYRLYIFPLVVALSSLILIIFVIYPQLISLITNQKAAKDILNKSKLLEVKAQNLESYDLTDLNRKVNYAVASYPTDKDSVAAIGIIQRVIGQFGFSIISITFGSSPVNSSGTQNYTFKLEIVGPTSLMPSLLTSIESSARLMRVSSVAVTNSSAEGASISLNIDLLYATAPTGFGSVDSPLPSLSEEDEEVIAKLARLGTPGSSIQASTQLGPRGKANPFE